MDNWIEERNESKKRNDELFTSRETQGHDCIYRFENEFASDKQWHEAYNRCYGVNPMILEIYHSDQDGCETFIDNWTETEVKYCPFCGKKGENNV